MRVREREERPTTQERERGFANDVSERNTREANNTRDGGFVDERGTVDANDRRRRR